MPDPLTIQTLDEALHAMDLNRLYAMGEERIAIFGPLVDMPAFQFITAIEQETIAAIRIIPTLAYPPDVAVELAETVNTWNSRYRWPRWYVSRHDDMLTIEGDHHVPCHAGIAPEQLADVLSAVLAASHQFWKEMSRPAEPVAAVLDGFARLLDESSDSDNL